MAENSKIEWCDHTFNPWRGCTKVAAGCANCYAERDSKRFPRNRGIWGPNGTRVLAAPLTWRKPLKWNRDAQAAYDEWHAHGMDDGPPPPRPRVFCASLADVFEDYNLPIIDHDGNQIFMHSDGSMDKKQIGRQVSLNDVRKKLFELIDATPNLDWQLLTKRPENILRMWPSKSISSFIEPTHPMNSRHNVWLGTSIAEQKDADKNIPELLKCRDLAPVLFLSCEPLIGQVDLRRWFFQPCPRCAENDIPCPRDSRGVCGGYRELKSLDIDWVIAGGESARNARPMHPDWPRSIRDQCKDAKVPFLFKQWGEWWPIRIDDDKLDISHFNDDKVIALEHNGNRRIMKNIGKKHAGRSLDGREWNEFPKVGVSV